MPALLSTVPLLEDLNDDQRRVVCWSGRALLVVAGPGSGKTRVIAARAAYRVVGEEVAPECILAITFTNRAASQLQQRVASILGAERQVRSGTFHWLCARILRRHGGVLGLPGDFRLLGPSEARATLRELYGAAQAPAYAAAFAAVRNGIALQQVAPKHGLSAANLALALTQYDDGLRRMRALDLDGLQHTTVRLLRDYPEVRAYYERALTEILVDEYQDTNPIQQELLTLLQPQSGSLVLVGDEDQAIYSWRQASVGTVSATGERFPDVEVIELRTTYRSTKSILRAATSVISHNADRLPKTLVTTRPAGHLPICYAAADESDEATWIGRELERVTRVEGISIDDCAVLFRVNTQARALEDAFLALSLAYHVVAGRRFYDRPEIRLAAAFLRLALDESDDNACAALLRSLPGIGDRRLAQLHDLAQRENINLLAAVAASPCEFPSSIRSRMQTLHRAVAAVHARRHERLDRVTDEAIGGVRGLISSPQVQIDDEDPLDELRAVAQEMTGRRGTLRGLIDRLTLSPDSPGRGRGVALSTLHAAKGLEFAVVFLAGCEEGLLPHRRALETASQLAEERRLCYVGMTRARSHLYLTYAHARMLGGQFHAGTRSRFLLEMGVSNMEVRSSPHLSPRRRLEEVVPGEQVAHPRWGTGTVVTVQGAGRETLATIAFVDAGTKRIQLCHAPLTRPEGMELHGQRR